MVMLHLVNFIGLEILYALEFADGTYNLGLALYLYLVPVSSCYFAYMTFVLFYLVYCFGRNRHLGTTVYEESLL